MKNKDVILLHARIKESTLTDACFATEAMRVHPRTLTLEGRLHAHPVACTCLP